jgi:acetyl-CoA C-acetyltransferase
VVIVLAHENRAKKLAGPPVWVDGVGFANGSPTLESRDWVKADYVTAAARSAYRQAGITQPSSEIDILEVDDTYSYKELQHLVALEMFDGKGSPSSGIPINVSGGALGMGYTLEATGLYRIVELVLQLRGHAGPRQVKNARRALAQSWRGVPTTSTAIAILSAS